MRSVSHLSGRRPAVVLGAYLAPEVGLSPQHHAASISVFIAAAGVEQREAWQCFLSFSKQVSRQVGGGLLALHVVDEVRPLVAPGVVLRHVLVLLLLFAFPRLLFQKLLALEGFRLLAKL